VREIRTDPRRSDLWKGHFYWFPDDWLVTFAYLRAIEWCSFPLFSIQPIAPVALVFAPAWAVVVTVLALNWSWRSIRYRLLGVKVRRSPQLPQVVSFEFGQPRIAPLNLVRIAAVTQWFVQLKWPLSLAAGIFLYGQGRAAQALIAGLWPLLTMLLLMPFSGASGYVGVVQKCFLLAMGFKPIGSDPDLSRLDEFRRPLLPER
jgi:hypothetical protein